MFLNSVAQVCASPRSIAISGDLDILCWFHTLVRPDEEIQNKERRQDLVDRLGSFSVLEHITFDIPFFWVLPYIETRGVEPVKKKSKFYLRGSKKLNTKGGKTPKISIVYPEGHRLEGKEWF